MLVKIESTNQGSLQYSLLINSTINYTIKTQKSKEKKKGINYDDIHSFIQILSLLLHTESCLFLFFIKSRLQNEL